MGFGTVGASDCSTKTRPANSQQAGSVDEADKAAKINNWTVGLAGGLLEGTFSKYAADMGKALDDSDNMRVLPIISYWLHRNHFEATTFATLAALVIFAHRQNLLEEFPSLAARRGLTAKPHHTKS